MSLSSGSSGSKLTDDELSASWDYYNNPDEVDVRILMAGGYTSPVIARKINSVCERRRDCIGVLNVPTESQATSALVKEFAEITLNMNTSYAALYTPDVKVSDQYNGSQLYVPPDGYVGAVYALTDFVRDAWYAPAGLNRGLLNILDVRHKYSTGDQDVIYSSNVNYIRSFVGLGSAIWGQKTLQKKASALSRVNVRRLLIVLEKSISRSLLFVNFELNNQTTRLQVFQFIDAFLSRIRARNGVYNYQVVVDETNNTPEIIDANQLNVDVYIQPQRAAEFIRPQTVITRTGASFEELIATGGNF